MAEEAVQIQRGQNVIIAGEGAPFVGVVTKVRADGTLEVASIHLPEAGAETSAPSLLIWIAQADEIIPFGVGAVASPGDASPDHALPFSGDPGAEHPEPGPVTHDPAPTVGEG